MRLKNIFVMNTKSYGQLVDAIKGKMRSNVGLHTFKRCAAAFLSPLEMCNRETTKPCIKYTTVIQLDRLLKKTLFNHCLHLTVKLRISIHTLTSGFVKTGLIFWSKESTLTWGMSQVSLQKSVFYSANCKKFRAFPD